MNKYSCLCFNKSVFNWTFCQLLYSRKNPNCTKITSEKKTFHSASIMTVFVDIRLECLTLSNDLAYCTFVNYMKVINCLCYKKFYFVTCTSHNKLEHSIIMFASKSSSAPLEWSTSKVCGLLDNILLCRNR